MSEEQTVKEAIAALSYGIIKITDALVVLDRRIRRAEDACVGISSPPTEP
jgi:hypothetical protein